MTKATEELVTYVLEQFPATRGNDNRLTGVCLKKLGYPTDLIELANVTDVSVTETITRWRRKIQAERPDLRPDPRTLKNRRKRQVEFEEAMR